MMIKRQIQNRGNYNHLKVKANLGMTFSNKIKKKI